MIHSEIHFQPVMGFIELHLPGTSIVDQNIESGQVCLKSLGKVCNALERRKVNHAGSGCQLVFLYECICFTLVSGGEENLIVSLSKYLTNSRPIPEVPPVISTVFIVLTSAWLPILDWGFVYPYESFVPTSRSCVPDGEPALRHRHPMAPSPKRQSTH